jgi:multidrug efflux pump subunit AcrB
MPPANRRTSTSAVAAEVERLLKDMPGVNQVLAIVGFSLLDGAAEPNSAFLVAQLKPFADRRSAAESAGALMLKGRTVACPIVAAAA